MTFARKINKIPAFYTIFAWKMPEFYIIIARKIFSPNFFWGGTYVSYAYAQTLVDHSSSNPAHKSTDKLWQMHNVDKSSSVIRHA